MESQKLKFCVYTSTRAEYGLLYWVMKAMEEDNNIVLHIIVSGTHLSSSFGSTVKEIEKDKWSNIKKIKTLAERDEKKSLIKSVSIGNENLSNYLEKLKPNCMLILGDRFELFSVMTSCTILGIPIAHISGGEITEGAIDNQIRHAITKLAHLHFVANSIFKKRVLQMGEEKWRVKAVGETGLDNIYNLKLLDLEELGTSIGVKLNKNIVIVTFHPVTLEENNLNFMITSLLEALNKFNFQIVFTYPNTDPGYRTIILKIKEFIRKNSKRSVFIKSLGQLNFLSLMKLSRMIIGNSSSGIVEAPSFNLPCINIGNRQKGRVMSNNVINCSYETKAIIGAIKKGLKYNQKKLPNPYGKGNSSILVKNTLKQIFNTKNKSEILKKKFVDYEI